MIKVVIVEDEKPAVERLIRLLSKYSQPCQIVKVLDSVSEAIIYFASNGDFDLVFMDIQLGDGLSLDIFSSVVLTKPVIFITAYDEYVLSSFRANSIDYLLKPIEQERLFEAIDKYQTIKKDYVNHDKITSIMTNKNRLKQRFLVKKGDKLLVVNTSDIAYAYFEDGYTHVKTFASQVFLLDESIEQIYSELNPLNYFKINRKMIVHSDAIESIETYFNSRYSIKLNPPQPDQVIVSRERARDFKEWLQG